MTLGVCLPIACAVFFFFSTSPGILVTHAPQGKLLGPEPPSQKLCSGARALLWVRGPCLNETCQEHNSVREHEDRLVSALSDFYVGNMPVRCDWLKQMNQNAHIRVSVDPLRAVSELCVHGLHTCTTDVPTAQTIVVKDL